MKKIQRGFTLIELVLVIAILGVLAVAALPQIFGVSLTTARTNAMKATVSAVQTGLSLYAANQLSQGQAVAYPATLDPISSYPTLASGTAPVFGTVLQTGVTAQWIKRSATCYIYDFTGTGVEADGDFYFQYTGGTTGTFVQVANSGACT